MFVQLVSGETIYHKLADCPSITYTDTKLFIHLKSDSSLCIPIKKVKSIQYTLTPTLDDELIGPIWVYSIKGEYITTLEQVKDLNNTYLPWGIYILRGDNAARKILIK